MAALSPAYSATGEDAAKTLVDGASGLLNTSSIGRFSSTANMSGEESVSGDGGTLAGKWVSLPDNWFPAADRSKLSSRS